MDTDSERCVYDDPERRCVPRRHSAWDNRQIYVRLALRRTSDVHDSGDHHVRVWVYQRVRRRAWPNACAAACGLDVALCAQGQRAAVSASRRTPFPTTKPHCSCVHIHSHTSPPHPLLSHLRNPMRPLLSSPPPPLLTTLSSLSPLSLSLAGASTNGTSRRTPRAAEPPHQRPGRWGQAAGFKTSLCATSAVVTSAVGGCSSSSSLSLRSSPSGSRCR